MLHGCPLPCPGCAVCSRNRSMYLSIFLYNIALIYTFQYEIVPQNYTFQIILGLIYAIFQSAMVLRSVSKLMPTLTMGSPERANLLA